MPALATLLERDFRKRARIEIIPLIDVIFFLLATFVLFTLSLNRILSLEVELPMTDRPDKTPAEMLDLRVSDRGTLYWDKEPITLAELPARLADLARTEPNPKIMISSDSGALLGDATAVLDTVRAAKIKQVTFNTRPPAVAR